MLDLLKKLAGSSSIVGIDLGTSNSVVSVVRGGKVETIPNTEGLKVTPSVVAFKKDGEVLVGDVAARQAVVNPKNTIHAVKKLMGKTLDEAGQFPFTVPYEVTKDQNERAVVIIEGKPYLPQEMSAHILKYLKGCAEDYLGEKVKKVVISIPAYFGEKAREATIDSGHIAGFEDVVAIINEPTAAALAFSEKLANDKKILVVDLGGGTFDVSALHIKEQALEVLATSGDSALGGEDFDTILIQKMLAEFKAKHGVDLNDDPQAKQTLRDACVKAKVALSSTKSYKMVLPFLTKSQSGDVLSWEREISRQEFSDDIAPIIERCRKPLDTVLIDAGLNKKSFDEIILVGGSTRVPAFRAFVTEYFGREPLKGHEVDLMVSHGTALRAAIETSSKEDKKEIKAISKELIDVTSLDLGVEAWEMSREIDYFENIVERRTKLPCAEEKEFVTVRDNQEAIKVKVLQGMIEDGLKKVFTLGEVRLVDIPRKPKGEVKINVKFALDANGVMTVSAVNQETGQEQKVDFVDNLALEKQEREKISKVLALPEPEMKKLMASRMELGEKISLAEDKLNHDGLDDKTEKKLMLQVEQGKKVLTEEIKSKALDKQIEKITKYVPEDPKE